MLDANQATASKKQLREFGLLIGLVLPVVFGWLIPVLKGHDHPLWPFLIGVPSLALALIAPRLLRRPYQAWMQLGHVLGWINGHLILGAVFIFVLQPIAYLMRMTGYDPLKRRRQGLESYREQPKHKSTDLTRIF